MSDRSQDFFVEEQSAGVSFLLKVRRWLERCRTVYQDLIIAETPLGRLLALDGKVMLTEADEAFYHEMLVHPPLISHTAPRSVLVIGGGDGGTVREVLKHPTVSSVTWVEIDRQVLDACRRWLPKIGGRAWNDPRVRLTISAGEDWLLQIKERYDVILVDGSDPVGPSKALFEVAFFESCRAALADSGILALQCGSPFYFTEEVQSVWNKLNLLFPFVRLYLGFVPTYPSGLWSYAMASFKDINLSEGKVRRRIRERNLDRLQYYSAEIHQASQILPPFVERLIGCSDC